MQDPSSLYSQIKSQVNHHHHHQQQQQQNPNPQFPEQEHLKCPRCDSTNTKFCYYNNYNLSQPRHFCKSCKRYWTKGGTLRNIPVGGGSRKNAKRSSSSSSAAASSSAATASAKRPAPAVEAAAPASSGGGSSSNNGEMRGEALNLKGDEFGGQFGNFMDVSGSFSSLLGTSGGQFGNLFDGIGPNGPSLGMGEPFGGPGSGQNVDPQVFESGSSNGWTDLAMYTPGSTFQ